MAIGGPGDEPRVAAAPQKAVTSPTSAPATDRDQGPVKSPPPKNSDDAENRPVKPARAQTSFKENGHNIAPPQPVPHQPPRRFNHDITETPEAGASPPERDVSPPDTNGHSLPIRAHHQAHQQHMMNLTAAFDGLTVAGPPGHPQMVHPHHQMQLPHPHLAHRPHPGQLAGPPHQQPHHPHPHAHLHPGHPAAAGQHPQPSPHLLQPHGQPTTVQMWVPQDRVGAVIGSQGAVIKALQDKSRATIQVHNDTVRGDRKLFTIVGGHLECDRARQLVNDIIERPRSGHGPPSAGSQSPNHQSGGPRAERNSYSHYQDQGDRTGQLSKTVYVPTSCVGLVIGRRGETIRHLQGKSGASIFVTRDRDASQGATERSVLISGTEQAINTAHLLVSQIVREAFARKHATSGMNPGGAGGAQSATMMETLTVPDDKVGLIIGKGGAAIRELQSVSGAKIQVAKEDEGSSNNNTRPVAITGVRHCIEMAKQLIAEKVNMHLPPSSSMQNFSPPQGPPYAPTNTQMYFPMYEPGFGHPMPGPYQHGPPQQPYDPADPQAHMRAALAYYQYYGYSAAAAAAHHHQQQMQFQNEQQRQQQGMGMPQTQPHANAEGQEHADPGNSVQEGAVDPQQLQGGSSDTGEASQGQSVPEAGSPQPQAQASQQPELGPHHHHPGATQRNSYGMQDHRMHPQGVGAAGHTQPGQHMARQQMHGPHPLQHASHQLPHGPRGRMMPPQQHQQMHPQMAHQARVVAHMQAQAALHAQAQAQAHAHARHFQAAQAQAQAQQAQTQQPQSQGQSESQEPSPRNSISPPSAPHELTQRGGNTKGEDLPQK